LQPKQQGNDTMNSAWNSLSARAARTIAGAAFLIAVTASTALAETLVMPERDTRIATDVVVWGVTTQDNGTAYSLDCGDTAGTQNVAGNVADRSYITLTCNYPNAGVKMATLTVGAESDTVEVTVFDPAAFPGGVDGDENRGLGINMAIQDGLRHLWTTQSSRAAGFPASATTNWGNGFPYADAGLITLAFLNHGYGLANDGSAPTGLYEKYIVRRGLNYVMSQLAEVALDVTPQGDDPCVGVADGPAPCVGLRTPGDPGYSIPVAMLPFAASGALARVNTEVAGVTAGMTFGEILQRLSNAEAWGMTDGAGISRGGVGYQLNGGQFDGSTAGWAILGFLDAAAAGAIVPAWVASEFKFGFDNALNDDGSFDYGADGNPASANGPGPAKVGTGLQGLYFTGETSGARVDAVTANINSWWPGAVPFGIGGNSWGNSDNPGSAYTMFNIFKGLKLHGITTLPDVNRSTHAWAFIGTGAEDDWYADYQDWLVANQAASGSWGPAMTFSCCYSGDSIETAIAELILSSVALIPPDAGEFSRVGLRPPTQNRPIGGTATVTAVAVSSGGAPVPGASVNFVVLTGPNAGKSGNGVTNANGEATFSYDDTGPNAAHSDTVQAYIGQLESNIVNVNWRTGSVPPDSEPVPVGPATSLWALLLMIASLAVVGALVLRRP
jgi:hypothetical protein